MNTHFKISVIIPNLNSAFIDQTLMALRSQNFDLNQVEILVVGLDEPQLVQEDALVQLINTQKPVSPAVARNIGIKHAHGEVICFTDADCLPDRNWLKNLTAPIQATDIKVVGGGITFDTHNYWTWCDNLCWFHEFLVTSQRGERKLLPSLNLAVCCSVIKTVGMFDENYPQPGGEDADWTIRMRLAGFKLHFEPKAVVKHCPRRTNFKSVWHHGFIYGRFSTKTNPKYTILPFFLTKWWLLALFTPFLSIGATLKILLKQPDLSMVKAMPGIFIGKVAWCVGAMTTLWQQSNNKNYSQ